ncbi:hypothetical protein M1N79_01990 [Dehalococcoidia bacterium]|nr:hypothetical protein [Dehalococcoidia bacterium]
MKLKWLWDRMMLLEREAKFKGLKTMLLGLMVMLLAGFTLIDPARNLTELEHLVHSLMLPVGLLIGVIGLLARD